MRKLILIALALTLAIVPSVKAPTGTIRIDPVWPIMLASPADFEIWVEGAGNPTSNPNVFLVMTQGCWAGLSGSVVVSWSGGSVSFTKPEFADVTDNGLKVPSESVAEEGARYTVGSLKEHLSYGLSEPLSGVDTIYWAMKPFLSGDLTDDHQSFTITFTSSDPRMLVYALGKTAGFTHHGLGETLLSIGRFNNKVPPTRPGFMVPELGPILLTLASFSALALYTVKRRKTH